LNEGSSQRYWRRRVLLVGVVFAVAAVAAVAVAVFATVAVVAAAHEWRRERGVRL
jgi:hypothetical protein